MDDKDNAGYILGVWFGNATRKAFPWMLAIATGIVFTVCYIICRIVSAIF